jgi:hypothetical protein
LLGWYLGVVVLDLVKGERVLEYIMFNIMHVRTFVEECWIKLLPFPPELPLPLWRSPANPYPFEITLRGDPTTTLAAMITRDPFDKTVHSLGGTWKAPIPDGIPNEIIKFLTQATHSALYSLLSLLAHKAYNPPDRCHTRLLHKKVTPN